MHAHDKHRIVLDNDMATEKYYFSTTFLPVLVIPKSVYLSLIIMTLLILVKKVGKTNLL